MTKTSDMERSPGDVVKDLEAAVDASSRADDRQKNWDDLYRLERALLGLKDTDGRPNGVCLSGGGVRSAVTCMGALSCLARRNILNHVHYVSSVSGGGYAAAALSTWLHDRAEAGERNGEADAQTSGARRPEPDAVTSALKVPFVTLNNRSTAAARKAVAADTRGAIVPTDAPKYAAQDLLSQNEGYIRHVRANINFLMPSGFKGVLVGVYSVLRSVLLNVFVWLVFTSLFFLVLMDPGFIFTGPTGLSEVAGKPTAASAASLSDVIWGYIGTINDGVGAMAPFGFAFAFGVLLLALLPVQMVYYSISTAFKQHLSAKASRDGAPKFTFNYRWRRFNEQFAQWIMVSAIILLAFGSIPILAENIAGIDEVFDGIVNGSNTKETDAQPPTYSAIPGTVAALFGIASSIFVFVRTRLGKVIGPKSSALVVVGSVALVYGVAILAFVFAVQIEEGAFPVGWAAVLLLFALGLAFACNINDVSLGRFYRDRLIEAFIPDLESVWSRDKNAKLVQTAPPATKADQLRLTHLRGQTRCIRPLHLVNTNVMSWWTDDTRARRRKGDNFIASAVGSGSDMTGWRLTRDLAGGKLTLATVMSASGAAVNPRGGFSGAGATTLLPVTLAMALLSLRLGYWLRWRKSDTWFFWLNRFGNRVNPSARQLLGSILPRRSKMVPNFVELTDGGHFENLGLYELIRRRCKIIIVCDAGEDPETSYASFTSAIRRVREDFGAEIHFDVERDLAPREANTTTMVDTGPEDLVARPVADQYPKGAEYAEKGYFLASVAYHDNPGTRNTDGYRASAKGFESDEGLIIYLKSAMIRTLEVTTKGYKGVNPRFPYDPTANQFFSPDQFEAYFDLGDKIAEQMVEDTYLDTQMAHKETLDRLLLANAAFRKKINVM